MLPFLTPDEPSAGPSLRSSPQAAILCTIASPRASCQERTAALYELEVSLKDELCDASAIAGARKRMRSRGGWDDVAPALLANLSRLHVHLSYLSTACGPCSMMRDADAARSLLAAEAGVCFSLLQGLALLAPGDRGDLTEMELLLALASAQYWSPATSVDLSHAPAHAISTISVLLLARPESLSSFSTLHGEAVLRKLLCAPVATAQQTSCSEQRAATAAAASELLAHLADREGAERLAAEELHGSVRRSAKRSTSDAGSSRSTSTSSGTDDDGPKTPTDVASFDAQRTPRKASIPRAQAMVSASDAGERTPRLSTRCPVVIRAGDAGEPGPDATLSSSPTKRVAGHSARDGTSRSSDVRAASSLMRPPIVPSKSSSLRLAVPAQTSASRSAPSTPRRRGGTVPAVGALATAACTPRGRTMGSPQRQTIRTDLEGDQQEMAALVSASPAVRRAHARSLSPTKPVPMRALPSLPAAAEDAEGLSGKSCASGRLAALQKSRPLREHPSRSRSPDGKEARRRAAHVPGHGPA